MSSSDDEDWLVNFSICGMETKREAQEVRDAIIHVLTESCILDNYGFLANYERDST